MLLLHGSQADKWPPVKILNKEDFCFNFFTPAFITATFKIKPIYGRQFKGP